MPVVNLRPAATNTTLENPAWASLWTVVGAASGVAALSDQSAGSYLRWHSTDAVDDRIYQVGTTTLAVNQRVTAIRLGVNYLKYLNDGVVGSTAVSLWTWYVYASGSPGTYAGLVGGGLLGQSPWHWFPNQLGFTSLGPRLEATLDPVLDATNTQHSVSGAMFPFRPGQYTYSQLNIPGAYYYTGWHAAADDGSLWTQAMLNNMAVLVTQRDTNGIIQGGFADVQWADVVVEVDVRTQPSVIVAQGVGTPLGATLTWTSTMNDGDVQSAWEVAVYSQAQTTIPGFDPSITAALFRLSGKGAAQTAGIPRALTVGTTYVAYVRVAKRMGVDTNGIFAAGSRSYDWFSNWASNTIFVSPVDTATYTPQLPNEGILGCHQWSVTGGNRGGTAIRVDLPWSHFQWGRKLQDVSTGSVTFPRSACTEIPYLADLRPWEHELGFWRDSETGPKLEWVGPITGRAVGRDEITLRARDWFSLLERRRIHADFDIPALELSTLFAAVFIDGLGPDNSAKLGIVIHASGVVGDRQYFSTQYRRTADVLREIGRAGVDWTMVGRTLLAGGSELGVASCRLLLDDHVLDISGDENGESAATDIIVVGAKGTLGTQAVAGIAIAGDPRGVLETVIQANDIQDNASALSYAASSLALLGGGVPRRYQVTLAPDTQSGYGRLIPGARWPVDIPSMDLFETLRLRQLDVNVTKSEDGQVQETVKAELTSLGQLGF